MISWLKVRLERGNERGLRFLRFLGSAWRALPTSIRLPLERLGRRLQLNRRLTPALVAVAAYPLFDRIGPWWSLVVIFPPLMLWAHAVVGRALSLRQQTLGFLVYFSVLFVVPIPLAIRFPTLFNDLGNGTGLAFRAGLLGLLLASVALALAIVLGDPERARSPLAVAGTGASVLVATFASVFLGVLPGWSIADAPARAANLGGWSGVFLDLGIASGLGMVVFLALRPWQPARVVGLVSARLVPSAEVIAWLLPAVFAYAALFQTIEKADAYRYTGRAFAHGLLPLAAPSSLTQTELADQYRPLFLLHRKERWRIASVFGYLASASLRPTAPFATAAGIHKLTLKNLPLSCARPARENGRRIPLCFALTANCVDVQPKCDYGHHGSWPTQVLPRGVVYARVMTRGLPTGDGSPNAFRLPLPFADLYALIQYWVFFRNDRWHADTLLGRLAQRHEADWEMVMVGLSASHPLFAAYSAHCAGTWRNWQDVATWRSPSGAARPVVWVARGSHAMYPDPTPRDPDFTSCKNPSTRTKTTIQALVYAANVRETLPDTFSVQDPTAQVINAHIQPFSFPGRWSLNDHIELANGFRSFELPPPSRRLRSSGEKPSGPETPSCKKLWADPLALIFCNQHWGDQSRCQPGLKAREASRWHGHVCI
jgi:hypothetical protein